MATLKIAQQREASGLHRVEITLDRDGQSRRNAVSTFDFTLAPEDQEALRWYLEDYLQYPFDPGPEIAKDVQSRMAKIGKELFRCVFQSSDDSRDLLATLLTPLDEMRVEIATTVAEATSIPWELLRDPETDEVLALRAAEFVRTDPHATKRPNLSRHEGETIRILLVICRPHGDVDIPFRSVASRLVKALSQQRHVAYQLNVLRPPTYQRLSEVLQAAKSDGRPYHIVHFDGHGTYLDLRDTDSECINAPLVPTERSDSHGYLLFENPPVNQNCELVDGARLGKLMVETDVPVLILNACRSAHAEPQEVPQQADGCDVHTSTRAFGSLAQEVIHAGVAGVVAMRYNIYVVTAAKFVSGLYDQLLCGHSLGAAVTRGRRQLAAQPLREIAYAPLALDDWCVPVVYEATPIRLFPRQDLAKQTQPRIDISATATGNQQLVHDLPQPPVAGFFGRDETLLNLDRAFDQNGVVLLHAYAGSGKTQTAAEFARWYLITGGLQGPVLFTSFEQYTPLTSLLDRVGQMFGAALAQNGIQWLSLDYHQRREVALHVVLEQVPVFWIWDNVEPVAGFPAGGESTWSQEEQQELADFLRDASRTKCKFLLTSRRDEHDWLNDLPTRVQVPPMPLQERLELARALAERRGKRMTDVADWRPLMKFTQGNPLTITVLASQALREGLTTREQVAEFVEKLIRGEQQFADQREQGRDRSLAASLSYGFAHAFSQEEHGVLALLALFQKYVNVNDLVAMGKADSEWCLENVRGLSEENAIRLLDRAAEIGLLIAHNKGHYTIHPALPLFFQNLLTGHYPATTAADGSSPLKRAHRAFVEVIGSMGDHCHDQYISGNRDVIPLLSAEESNLLSARRLARRHGWWPCVIWAMQGLRQLYEHSGRSSEWRRLVEEIVSDFCDSADEPLPGREDYWSLVIEYRIRLAREASDLSMAQRLLEHQVAWNTERSAAARGIPVDKLDGWQRFLIRTLSVSLHQLGQIQRTQFDDACVASYTQGMELAERIGDLPLAAHFASNLGYAYRTLDEIRDMDLAQACYERELQLTDRHDAMGRASCLSSLGELAQQRFGAIPVERLKAEHLEHLNHALALFQESLRLTPDSAVKKRATAHMRLGSVYSSLGRMDAALMHYRHSIEGNERVGDRYEAGQTRFNLANMLANAGTLVHARQYALAALRDYETCGTRAADKVEKTQGLLKEIEVKDLMARVAQSLDDGSS